MKKYNVYQKILVCILPIVAAIVMYFAAVFVSENFTFPECPSYRFFDIYCFGCGMTRAVIALIHGDILLSLRQNLLLVVALLVLVLFYTEFVLRVFGKNVRLPIHSTKLLFIFLAFFAVYFVARNFIPAIAPV